jgi:hypothetical protein
MKNMAQNQFNIKKGGVSMKKIVLFSGFIGALLIISYSVEPNGAEAASGHRNPIQIAPGLGVAVPVGGVCRTDPERWAGLQTLVQAYIEPVRKGQYTEAIKAVEIALPQLENAVRADPYCLNLLSVLAGAYDVRIGAYAASSNQGSGVVVPLTDCNVTFGLAAIARIEKFAAKNDPVRGTVAQIKNRLQSYIEVQKQVEPDCW